MNKLVSLFKTRKYQILLLIIGILLITSGVTLAYFSINNISGNQNIVTSGVMKLTFSDGPEVKLDNAIPGDTVTKTFSITNTGNVATTYDLYFSELNNTFGDPMDLVYTITSTDGGYSTSGDTQLPTTSSKFVSNYAIEPNVTHTYTLTIKFLAKDENQDDNQGKEFSAKISVNDMSDSGPYAANYGVVAYVDGTLADNIPEKTSAYLVDSITCTNGATATWNYNNWGINILNTTKSGTTCNVYFVSGGPYADGTGAAIPELYQGLVPIMYDSNGNIVVADTTKEWYNYSSHNWANAALVNASDATIKSKYFNDDMSINKASIGQIVSLDDILEMYVWIPRYKYLLWNAENGSSNPQAISITFESKETTKSSGTKNGEWLTHPAFTFGTTELNGIWVGKFENGGSTTGIQIKPNIQSLTNLTVGAMFNATRNVELTYASNYGISASQVDTHMMKNMDWGAVAYLSSSIYGRYNDSTTCISSGCEVWINNVNTSASGSNGPSITGCSASSVSASVANSMSACATGYDWAKTGTNASTTGNMYGIYDMSGGTWEYVMGNMSDSSGNYYSSSSGLSKPDTKYYNNYVYSASNYTNHAQGGIGDATKETLKTFGNSSGGWYNDYAFLPVEIKPWIERSGNSGYAVNSGIFYFGCHNGGAFNDGGFRSVLTAN